jgi:membrane peptidoglycan carboxypeptidase
VARGKMLGGKAPKRGGRLTRRERQAAQMPDGATQLLAVVTFGSLVLGAVLGFAAGMDRQLRGGILRQRDEAASRSDWVALDQLPEYLVASFLTVVDPGFEAGGSLRSRDEGNSIPRELVWEIHMLGDGLAGEAQALVMAPVLEQRASKREILELYLNRVQLGRAGEAPVFGVFHAAREYFGKDPQSLTLSEAATLAGMLLAPRIDQPQERPGAIGVRRNEVLAALLSVGAITTHQYAAAIVERLGFQPGLSELPMSRRLPSPTDTVVTRLPVEAIQEEPSP